MQMLEWFKSHHIAELFFTVSLMCVALIILALIFRMGWKTFLLIGETRRVDGVDALKEKQRLKELEIEELRLRLRLRETQLQGENLCSPM